MRRLNYIRDLLVLAVLVFGVAFAYFAVVDSPGTPLAKSAGSSAMLTLLVVVVMGIAMARKRRKGELDEQPCGSSPEKAAKTDLSWPFRVVSCFFTGVVFMVMAFQPDRELMEVATVAARVCGWIIFILLMGMGFIEQRHKRRSKEQDE